MKRLSIATLIATLIALFASFGHASAATTWYEDRQVFMTDFRDGVFYGALVAKDGDSVQAITMQYAFDGGVTQEDFFTATGNMLPTRVQLDDRGYTGIMRMYSAEYDKIIRLNYTAYTDSAHIVGYCEASATTQGMTNCQLDGDQIQAFGFIQNGEIIKLRGANAFSTIGTGYLVQNGNLIRYTVENGEKPVYTVYVSLVSR